MVIGHRNRQLSAAAPFTRPRCPCCSPGPNDHFPVVSLQILGSSPRPSAAVLMLPQRRLNFSRLFFLHLFISFVHPPADLRTFPPSPSRRYRSAKVQPNVIGENLPWKTMWRDLTSDAEQV
jgi:hypothetical protein